MLWLAKLPERKSDKTGLCVLRMRYQRAKFTPDMTATDWEETFRFMGHPRAADPQRSFVGLA